MNSIVDTFHRAGFAHLAACATTSELQRLQTEFPDVEPGVDTLVENANPTLLPQGAIERCRKAAAACLDSVAELAFAQWYAKPPQRLSAVIDWHQDRAFWTDARPPTVTTWLGLDDADEHNGSLQFEAGSHLNGRLLPHTEIAVAGNPRAQRTCAPHIVGAPTTLRLAKGEGVIYHELVAHRSAGNATPSWRRALVLGWNRTGT